MSVVLAAAGCAPAPSAPTTTATATPQTVTVPSDKEPAATAPVRPEPAPPRTTARVAPPPRPAPDAGAIVGLGVDAVTALLGAPSFVRRDAPATFWQYRPKGCVLDVYLYPEADGAMRVRHVASRGAGGQDMAVTACTSLIVNDGNRTKQTSALPSPARA